jgi:hypothetical protein
MGIRDYFGIHETFLGNYDFLEYCETCIGNDDNIMNTSLDARHATSPLILRGKLALLDHLIEVVPLEDHSYLPSTRLKYFNKVTNLKITLYSSHFFRGCIYWQILP